MNRKYLILALLMFVILLSGVIYAFAIDENESEVTTDLPMANVINDEGGAAIISGELAYSNPFFTYGISQPVIILEDQAGFVDRNEFYLFPKESQVLAQITSDFLTSPFSYSLTLPVIPRGALRDVDNDGETDTGVMVFSVAYWSNTFGDPFLEERDLYGGGWSTAYATTISSRDPELRGELVGGHFVIYAPDDQQGFPSGFGEDGLLFTEDDPTVRVPAGYSVVDINSEPFTFDRSREQELDLLEPEGAALVDYSNLSYTDAFDSMVEKMRNEYAFTEYYGIDWNVLHEKYQPRFAEAEANRDEVAFALAMRDFLWEIPDGHVSMSLRLLNGLFQEETAGGLGLAIRELDDGRIITTFITEDGPANEAGIELTAEIIAFNGRPVTELMEENFIWAHVAFGSPHTLRLQQLRYVTRFPLNTDVEVAYQNPGDSEPSTVVLATTTEQESWASSSFNVGISGLELPVEYEILPSGYALVNIYSFSDDRMLTVQLWERMLGLFNQAGVRGIIIDMRNNGGGSGFLSDQMAAYFFNEPLELGQKGYYDEEVGEFVFDPRGIEHYFLPSKDLRYNGDIVVIVGPACFSACEFFTYNMTLQDRAEVVGHYPTGGLGGSVDDFVMPAGIGVRFTVGRAVDMDGNIHIEGKGVAPTIQVPVTEEALFGEGDVLLEAAIEYLDSQ